MRQLNTNGPFFFRYVNDQTLSRCLVFESILRLINSEQLTLDISTKIADDLACILIEKYSAYFNKRYFKDSMVRIICVLIFMSTCF